MAKKSARSKGYRKQTGKKPYLSKRDIIMLCILLAVVAVGAILLFSYDDGGLKTKGGQIVDAGENWLIVNGAASGGKRYYKVGEVGELEGFTREGEPVLTDANLQSFRYTPEDESGALRSISISASAATVERLSEYYHDLLGASLTTGEVTEASCAAGDYTYFTYTNAYHAAEEAEDAAATEEDAAEGAADAAEAVLEEAAGDAEPAEDAAETDEPAEGAAEDGEPAEDAEAEPNRFEQAINAYIAAKQHGSVVITAAFEVDSAEDYLDDEALRAVVEQAIAAVTFEEK